MSSIGIIGLLCAIVVLAVGAYRGVGALPLTLLAALVAIVTNAPSIAEIFTTSYIWESFSGAYMGGYASAYMSYLLMFAFSSLYAILIQKAGCAQAIAYKLIDWFGTKHVILVSILVISFLTYGGVSLFVVVYAVAPIMFTLFKEKNIPRHLTMGCLIMGSATYTMTALPGTPALTNLVPTEFLGTTLTAAPVLGILCSIAMFTIGYVYMLSQEKKAIANNEGFTYPDGYNFNDNQLRSRESLPKALNSFLPSIILITFIILGSRIPGANATMIATYAMIVSTIAVIVLNFDKLKGESWIKTITEGLDGGIDGIGGIAAVLAFGAVVKITPAFVQIVDAVLKVEMHPYFRGILCTMVFSGITGSSSGGLRITLEALQSVLVNSGVNMETLHRLMSISADALDTLPHSPGLFLMFSVLGLKHKEAYKHVFVTSTIAPLLVTIVAAIICVTFGF